MKKVTTSKSPSNRDERVERRTIGDQNDPMPSMQDIVHSKNLLCGKYIRQRITNIRAVVQAINEKCELAFLLAPSCDPGYMRQQHVDSVMNINEQLTAISAEFSSVTCLNIQWPKNSLLWAADRYHLSDMGVMYMTYWLQQELWEKGPTQSGPGYGQILRQPIFHDGPPPNAKGQLHFGYRTPPSFREKSRTVPEINNASGKPDVLILGDSNFRIIANENPLVLFDWDNMKIMVKCVPGLSLYSAPEHLLEYFKEAPEESKKSIKLVIVAAATNTVPEHVRAVRIMHTIQNAKK